MADAEITTRALQSACSKRNAWCGEQIRTLLNRSRGCQTLINLRRGASSRTHLVLQAYCLTDIDEINPLGIKFGTERQDVFRYSLVSRQLGRCLKSIELDTQAYSRKTFLSSGFTVSGWVTSAILQRRKQEHACAWISLIEIYFGLQYENIVSVLDTYHWTA